MNGDLVCTAEKADFRGWKAACLRNGVVSLVAVPDIGGRVMAYDLGSYPFLFVDPDLAGRLFTAQENQGDGSLAAWKNYGGDKTWPAPQGWDREDQWHGPPDPVLDTGRYTLAELAAGEAGAMACMVSPPDPRTGLQITRRITLHPASSRVTLDLTFTNRSNRVVRWSIWDVTQFRAERTLPDGRLAPEPGCTVTAPLNPHSRFPRGFNVMFGAEDNPQWGTDPQKGLFVGKYLWEIGKVGIDSTGDWIAFSNAAAGVAFAGRYQYSPGAEYPDGGVPVECWTVGKGKVANLDYEQTSIYLMEAEILSPMLTFQPGESRSAAIQWGACHCPGPVVQVNEAGCTGQPLSTVAAQQAVKLSGGFGAFDLGELRLAWKDGRGSLIKTDPLGPASPLQKIQLDSLFERPEGARSVELQVAAQLDGAVRVLASADLTE